MGLARVREVAGRLPLACPAPVVTVTGTNGKGSTCAMLDAMFAAAGYRVGLYTSPHLTRYNERVRIAGREVSDGELLAAFDAVEDARTATGIALTYFEFGTLAAFWLFARAKLDARVLEVGLGGRLDAVNLIDADIAVVTSVALDHLEYLGPTRDDVGREKAGIFRPGRPAVCGDPDPPPALVAAAQEVGAKLWRIGIDFGYVAQGTQWRYFGPGGERFGLPIPALRGGYQLANAAAAIMALDLLRDTLPVSMGAIREGLAGVALEGRFQVLAGRPTIVLDVAHNPHAARALATTLGTMGFHPETHAVFGMLADKDIRGVVDAMKEVIDRWHVAPLPAPRGADATALAAVLVAAGVAAEAIRTYASVETAFGAARAVATEADRITVFGSFLTVAAALRVRDAVKAPSPQSVPHG
jgi:dihydrofolate synthase/folylpolyglutamate synthase